ncbi:MAG: hypothetical protein EBR75_00020 [Actinobacteria bacterium]|nr:hypothetical protein [Actinomycetota bacterium]
MVFTLIAGYFSIQPTAQAAQIKITVSIKIMIKITFGGAKRPSYKPPESSLSPLDVRVVPGATGSTSVDIAWSKPKSGTPKNGYTVELTSINKEVIPNNGSTWSIEKYNVASDVTEMRVTDLRPSSIYEVNVKSNDEYGAHDSEPASFCSPKFYASDAGCIATISATKANYAPIPDANLDPSANTFNLPDKSRKNGAINVSWSAASNVSSYIVQWFGQQNVLDYGEKIVPASETRTTISGLPGNHLYYVKVLALGANGGYSESPKVSVYASPGATGYPELSGSFDTCMGIGDFIVISINSQTPQSQSDRLATKAFLTRFRKQGDTVWLNADQVLKDGKRCFTVSTYPDPSERRWYFLPDYVSNYEFQVAEVSSSPTSGAILGDWSYSRWYGPNSVALNKIEVEKLGPSSWLERDAFVTKNTNAIPRFNADREYVAVIDKLREDQAKQEADAKAAAELKAQQDAEAKALAEKTAAELKAKQDAEAKAAADKSAAELKAKQEADAKAAADLKAKQDADAKAAADLKAKQDADAKAAEDLKAKQDADAKAAEDLKAKQEADAKSSATKKTTITCIKGKLTKKVTAVNPKCPSGYKKK